MSPLIVACVAPADLLPEVDRLTGEVASDPRRADLTASDAAAVEHALSIASAWGMPALVVAAGPPELDRILLDLAPLGCAVVRVGPPVHGHQARGRHARSGADLAGDPRATAQQLARAISARGEPSLVICGDRSADHGVGAVPAFLAHELGLDQALGLVTLSVGASGRLTAERRLDGGWRERLEISGPAVISVEAAGVRLRRAGLAASLSVGADAVEVAEAVERPTVAIQFSTPVPYRPRTKPIPAPSGEPRERLVSLTGALSNREPPRVIGPLEAGPAADEILDFLAKSGVEQG